MNVLNGIWDGVSTVAQNLPGLASIIPPREEVRQVIVNEVQMIRGPRYSGLFVRLAGISGATAVMMAAYGAHAFKKKEATESQITAFANGNKMHLVHSVALLGTPLTRKPLLVGTLFCLGILIFSGSCYCHALTGNTRVRTLTPYGGMALILAWVAMIF